MSSCSDSELVKEKRNTKRRGKRAHKKRETDEKKEEIKKIFKQKSVCEQGKWKGTGVEWTT